MFALASLLPLALLPICSAVITPTTPDGTTVVNVGATLNAAWDVDTTGNWTSTTIQLMTGDNFNMVALKTLATGIDGTSTTTFSTPCPAVSPNAKIYFLQFTQDGDESTATWTTRFTIAATDGTTTQPTNTTNYSGTDVQWGTGALLDDSSSNSTSASASPSPSGSVASSASASPSSSSHSGVTLYNPSTSTSASAASGSGASGSVVASSASGAASTAKAAASASQSKSAAGALGVGAGVGAGVGLLGMVMSFLL